MANYDEMIGVLTEGKRKRKVALAAGLLVLIVSFAFLGLSENGTTMTDRRSLLSNTGSSSNINHNSINADGAARTREMRGGNEKPATSLISSAKTQNIHNIQNKQHVEAVHEWKTSEENADIDADATGRTLYRACPPGVDSVTGSFCGLSYEQICCFCPQPLDCDSTGCPADADGIVRDGCFHSITIPCLDVDCSVDQMTDRAVELGK